MGPRPFSRGNYLASVNRNVLRGLLQWGHGLSAVETCSRWPGHHGQHPGFNGATAFQPWKLAIGRAVDRGVSGFNGATAFQPWKQEASVAACLFTVPASMGPRPFSRGNTNSMGGHVRAHSCFNGATAFQPWKRAEQGRHRLRPNASMGPRPFSRGNTLPSVGGSPILALLQWGHGLSAVETP